MTKNFISFSGLQKSQKFRPIFLTFCQILRLESMLVLKFSMVSTELVISMPTSLSTVTILGNYIISSPKLGMTLSTLFTQSSLQRFIIKPWRFYLLILSQTGHFLSFIVQASLFLTGISATSLTDFICQCTVNVLKYT